ncbi:MAG: serine/threonine-protein kinase, partial [Wenzhouxiangella sp.]|nr:serine/threonine-protein kinase [Wenzhouxiangella sp.]
MSADDQDDQDLTLALNRALLTDDQPFEPGSLIGHFMIERRLGEGGMGTVWLAEQIEPVRRQVAIKLTRKRRMSGPELDLFMVERQALARFNHPAVGQIYEAGALDDGTPYFVMEYVEGSTIAKYCAQRNLTIVERIELMRRVCQGIAHAHQKGVLHCDLNPSNIVVTELDGVAQPKIIDFGLARALDRGQAEGYLIGTIAYLAPEQADRAASLDTRTDVHALGIILFELLAGRRLRSDLASDADLAPDDLQAMLARAPTIELPARPAEERLPRQRRMELEAIIRRATDPDPDGRYGGAEALADDLAAWLALEPVAAMPASTGYRWRCSLRRHRLAYAIAGLAALSIVAGLIGTSLGLREATEQQAIAEQRQQDLAEVVRFQQKMLAEIDMNDLAGRLTERLAINASRLAIREGQEESVAEQHAERMRSMIEAAAPVDAARDLIVDGVLGQSSEIIDRDYQRGDRIEAALRLSLGQTLLAWQAFDAAERQIERARAVYAQVGDRTSRDALAAETEAIKLGWWRQQFPAAYELARATRPRAEAALGVDDALSLYLLRAETSLSSRVEGPAVAVAMGRMLVERLSALNGSSHPDTLQARSDLLYNRIQGSDAPRCSEALIDDFRELLAEAETLTGSERRLLAVSSLNLGTCLSMNGQFDQAERWLARAAELARSVLGERHAITMVALNDWAYTLLVLNRLEESEDVVDSLYEQQRAIFGDTAHELFQPRSYRYYLAGAQGRADSAITDLNALIDEAGQRPETRSEFLTWLHLITSWTHER